MKTNTQILCKDSENNLISFENNEELTAIASTLLDAVRKSDLAKKHSDFSGKPLELPIVIAITITESNE